METVHTVAELRRAMNGITAPVGLVPTMGAFHAGHQSLVDAARRENGTVVVSLFVNPTQFTSGTDLSSYPRQPEADESTARDWGTDILFAPTADDIYPDGFDTVVQPGALAEILEGTVRPGHFQGVATVCLKLFNLVQPQRVYVGRKDAQQAAVIGLMLRDFDLAERIELRVLPTIRDADGLALSSRNVFLSPDERRRALALPRALTVGRLAYRSGGDPLRAARDVLEEDPQLAVDYVAVADFAGPTLAAAIRVGATRLIDNVLLTDEDD
jgi:pantoate--beta-alanine ligase